MEELLDVVKVRVQAGYTLELEFENGERRLFDMTPYMEKRPFNRLKDSPLFALARIDYGTVTWPGEIDIAPETLYDRSVPHLEKLADAGPALALFQEPATGQRLLRATLPFAAGAVAQAFTAGARLAAPTRFSIQVGEAEHIHLAPDFLQYLNHSCAPNLYFDLARGLLVCLRGIAPGDELTCFYPATEWSMAEPFACRCQAEACLGTIQGAAHLDPALAGRYRFAAHIVARWAAAP
jgi:hypothetical protein